MTLIVNAAQAIDGEAQITGSTTHDVDCVATRIADTGQGNCAGERPRVFEPFLTTKPMGDGTGLGCRCRERSLPVTGKIEVGERTGGGYRFYGDFAGFR